MTLRTSGQAVAGMRTSGKNIAGLRTDGHTLSLAAAPDLQPGFGTSSIANIAATQNAPITSVVLPAATSGDAPITYTIAPKLPDGLTFTAATRTLAGTPTSTQAATIYTYTASDADGDTAALTFSITIAAAVTGPWATLGAAGAFAVEFVASSTVNEMLASGSSFTRMTPSDMFTNTAVLGFSKLFFFSLDWELDITNFTANVKDHFEELADTWWMYLVDTTDEEWVAWQANGVSRFSDSNTASWDPGSGSPFGNLPNSRRKYDTEQSSNDNGWFLSDDRHGNTMILALVDNASYEPY